MFYWVFIGFYCVLLCIAGFYWVWLGLTGFYRVLLGFTWFYWVLLGFTGFYWVLPSFTWFYWVLLGFTGLLIIILLEKVRNLVLHRSLPGLKKGLLTLARFVGIKHQRSVYKWKRILDFSSVKSSLWPTAVLCVPVGFLLRILSFHDCNSVRTSTNCRCSSWNLLCLHFFLARKENGN